MNRLPLWRFAVLAGLACGTDGEEAPESGEPGDSAHDDSAVEDSGVEDSARPVETWSGAYSLANADAAWTGESAGDMAGYAVSFAGDVDGDGRDDVLIGAPGVDVEVELLGAAYLVQHASRDGGGSLSEADAKLVGEAERYAAGLAVAAAGDVDGDGFDDLAIGAPSTWSPYSDRADLEGKVYLVSGLGTGGSFGLDAAEITWRGEAPDDCFGASLASGDVDGDGLSDLAMGAPVSQMNGSDSGGAYLMLGANLDGDAGAAEADVLVLGAEDEQCAGGALSLDGDIDGDGLKDLLISGHWSGHWCDGGGAYLALADSLSALVDLTDADARWTVPRSDPYVGQALVSPGDMDGDGLDDVVIASPGQDLSRESYAGAIFLVPGAVASGTEELYDVATAIWEGESEEDWLGWSVDGAGDLDHDGRADLVFGATGVDGAAGAACLALGANAAGTITASQTDARWIGEPTSEAGFSVSGGGDADGDGEPDLLVSSIVGTDGVYAGLTWLLLSPTELR